LLDIVKRKADVMYNLVNGSLELITNVSPAHGSAYINPFKYHDVLRRILPVYPANLPKHVTLGIMIFAYCQRAVSLSTHGTLARSYLKVLVLPWTIQQHGFSLIGVQEFPVENVVEASYCNKSYKVNLAPTSFYVFGVFCLVTITWCLGQLIPTIFRKTPVSTIFPDIDLLCRSPLGDDRTGVLSRLPAKFTSVMVEKRLSNANIRVKPTTKPQWDTTSWEMGTIAIR